MALSVVCVYNSLRTSNRESLLHFDKNVGNLQKKSILPV